MLEAPAQAVVAPWFKTTPAYFQGQQEDVLLAIWVIAKVFDAPEALKCNAFVIAARSTPTRQRHRRRTTPGQHQPQSTNMIYISTENHFHRPLAWVDGSKHPSRPPQAAIRVREEGFVGDTVREEGFFKGFRGSQTLPHGASFSGGP